VSDTKTVLTTGANSGIGLATVLELARKGYRSVGSVRSEAKADAVHKAAADAGVTVETVLLDVTDADRCGAVVEELGPLFGLVNNAGYGVTGAVEDVDDDEARAVLETMVVAPMRLARLALPAMRGAKEGRIVNISSIMGRTTTPFTGWYQASKHALEAVTDALRIEVASANVKVVLVEPGGFKTGIWEEFERDVAKRDAQGSAFLDAYRRSQQLMKLAEPVMGDPSQVAKVVAGALSSRSPRARYLVGIDANLIAFSDRFTPTAIKDRVTRLGLGI
jgi:NAD(P)-dependent dehydrogenase (short-subunit alcohol dehydrogenase family)